MKPVRIILLLVVLAAAAVGAGFWLAGWQFAHVRPLQKSDSEIGIDYPMSGIEFVRTSRSPRNESGADRSTAEGPSATPRSLVQRLLLDGDQAKLSRQQVEAYLAQERRSAHSLVAASRLLDDDKWLHEAAERFPNDPLVQLAMLQTDLPLEARWDWIDALVAVEPDNALGHYAAAREHFVAGDFEAAIEELQVASACSIFDDHGNALVSEMAATYRSAGYDPVEAGFLARLTSPIVAGGVLRDIGNTIVRPLRQQADLALQAGDQAGAESLLNHGMDLAFDLAAPSKDSPAPAMISELMGFAVERRMLADLDLESVVPGEVELSVGQRLLQIEQRTRDIKATSNDSIDLLLAATQADQRMYMQKLITDGEMEAFAWLQQKYAGGAQRNSAARQ